MVVILMVRNFLDSSCSIYFNGKSMQQLTGEDVIWSQFVTLIDAENFYSKYSKVMGFNIRKNDIQYDNDGETYVRRWVCKREGDRAKNILKGKIEFANWGLLWESSIQLLSEWGWIRSLVLGLLFLNTYMSWQRIKRLRSFNPIN